MDVDTAAASVEQFSDWYISSALALQPAYLLAFGVIAGTLAMWACLRLVEFGFLGKLFVYLVALILSFGVLVGTSYVAPQFFDPGSLIDSQKVKVVPADR